MVTVVRVDGATPSGPRTAKIGALGRGLGRRTSARPSDERTSIGRGRLGTAGVSKISKAARGHLFFFWFLF